VVVVRSRTPSAESIHQLRSVRPHEPLSPTILRAMRDQILPLASSAPNLPINHPRILYSRSLALGTFATTISFRLLCFSIVRSGVPSSGPPRVVLSTCSAEARVFNFRETIRSRRLDWHTSCKAILVTIGECRVCASKTGNFRQLEGRSA